jgi:hypothetical protein
MKRALLALQPLVHFRRRKYSLLNIFITRGVWRSCSFELKTR